METVAPTTQESKMPGLKPGIYRDVTYDDYAAWPGVNASILNGFSRTPAHVYHEMTHGGKERTPALDLGWLVHLAVLEPERFKVEIAIPPKVDRRTKAGKAAMAEFEAENPGKMLVDVEMHKKVVSMAGAIFTNETAHEFFVKNPGANELSFAWLDPATELMCKGRADRIGQIGEWPVVGDLKTARDASRREIEKAIEKFGYHIQAAHYLDGLQTIHPVPEGNPFRRYMLFVIESEPPYLCASYEIDDIALEEGLSQRRQYMNQYAECVETGYWPGYPAGVEYVSLPAWHFKIYREG